MIREYLRGILKRRGLCGVLLFGSLAKGSALPHLQSDVDLIVVCEDLPSDLFERAELVRRIEGGPSIVQSIWMTPEDFEGHLEARAGYVLDAIHDGLILYDKAGFLKRRMEKTKEELRRREVKRIDGAWVWPLRKAGEVIEL